MRTIITLGQLVVVVVVVVWALQEAARKQAPAQCQLNDKQTSAFYCSEKFLPRLAGWM